MSPPTSPSIFAKRLKTARLELGISQRELGRRIGLLEDVVSNRVTRYELGTSEPRFATANKLAKALGVPLAYLVADNDILADIILAIARMSPIEQQKFAEDLKAKQLD